MQAGHNLLCRTINQKIRRKPRLNVAHFAVVSSLVFKVPRYVGLEQNRNFHKFSVVNLLCLMSIKRKLSK